MEQLFIVALLFTILITFYLYISIRKIWGFWVFLGVFIFWLTPIYPIYYIIGNSSSKGFPDSLGVAIAGFFYAVGWFVLFPIVAVLTSKGFIYYFKPEINNTTSNLEKNSKRYLEYFFAILFILCFIYWWLLVR